MIHDVTPARERLDSRLGHMRHREHLPSDLVELLGDVARMQLEARPEARFVLPEERAPADEILQGRAMVERERLPYDETQAGKLFAKLLERLGREEGPLGEAAAVIEADVAEGRIEPAESFRRVLADDGEYFETHASRTPEAPRALYFLAYSAMSPGLWAAAAELAKDLPDPKTWRAGTCPVCGSLPLITELREKEGFRHATCSLCNHEYRVRRLACVVCGEGDISKLTFFTVEEEPGFRVDVCASCNCYVKCIDFRQMDRSPLPRFDDLDSLSLDFVAREQGYARPTLSGWGF